MLNPVAMSIITNTFTDPRERAQAVGVWGAVFGVSMALGPIVGGALVSTAGWEWIFLMNIPLGLAAIALTLRFVPESRAPRPRRFDPVGQVLVDRAAGLGDLRDHRGAGAPAGRRPRSSSRSRAAAVALLGTAASTSRAGREPLIDLRFFRSIPFSSSIAISVAAFASFGGFLFLNTLYLQDVRGLSPVEAGIAIVPIALMTVDPVSDLGPHGRSPRAAHAARHRRRLPAMVACGMLVDVGPKTPFAWLVAAYVVFGIGFGFVNAPITNAAVSGMPRAQAGVAAAIATTSRQFGQAIGVAIVGAIVASGAGGSAAAELTSASQSGLVDARRRSARSVLVLGLLATGSAGHALGSADRRSSSIPRRSLPRLAPHECRHDDQDARRPRPTSHARSGS